MRKLAIKVKLKNASGILKSMQDAGLSFGNEYQQFDRVFVPRGYEQAYPDPSLAPQLFIRTNTIQSEISHMMILKRPVNQYLTYFFQTQVMDYNQTAHIISNTGYELLVEIPKYRRKLLIGSVVLYLDRIDGYGWFLKLEKNLKNHETDSTDDLWDLLTSFELTEIEEVGRYSEIIKGVKDGSRR